VSDRTDSGAARFARIVFTIAGIWGVVLMVPLYFLRGAIERASPPPITHADLYYGFIGVTLAWQIAFLIIATDPVRYHRMMVAAMLEKGLYLGAIVALSVAGQMPAGQAAAVVTPDGVLGLLFVVAYLRLGREGADARR